MAKVERLASLPSVDIVLAVSTLYRYVMYLLVPFVLALNILIFKILGNMEPLGNFLMWHVIKGQSGFLHYVLLASLER